MKKIDFSRVPVDAQSSYPAPFDEPCEGQTTQRLGRSQGLTHFGVNLTVIPAAGWSSQRHWHSHEDEFVWVLEGELTLVTNAGEEILKPGDCAATLIQHTPVWLHAISEGEAHVYLSASLLEDIKHLWGI